MTWGAQVGDRLVDTGCTLAERRRCDVQVSGYLIIDADSQEHLDGLLEGHPHTAVGGTISTQRFMEMPGM